MYFTIRFFHQTSGSNPEFFTCSKTGITIKTKWYGAESYAAQVEAIEATGASRLQVLWYGILPQVLPVIYGTAVYRWDINIRESTVLGFVGGGGIGILLYSSINQFLWQEVSLILMSVFGVVIISEFISATIRQRIS